MDHTESMKAGKRGGGLLKDMVEMPMDVLFEIFGRLEPLDLLNICRTTKALRAILMSRSSNSVWRSARSNVFGLPDCPDDLSEPQYAALTFVTECTFCPRNIPDTPIFWYARVRCCTTCATLNFTPASGRPSGERGCPALLTDWVPFVKLNGTLYISESTNNQWKDEYWAFKDPKSQHEWLLRTMETRYLIQKHARMCAFWHNAWSNNTDVEKLRQVLERNAEIMTYIKGIKGIRFEEELYKVPPTEPYLLDTLHIQPLWNYNTLLPWRHVQDSTHFTTQLEFLLSTKLSQAKRNRESLADRDLLTSRKPFVSAIYNNGIQTLPFNSPSPTLAQVYHITELHDLIDYSATVEAALRVPFDEVVALWKKHVDGKLIDVITSTCGTEHAFDAATVLDLATTFFRCRACYYDSHRPSMRRDEAIAHLCEEANTADPSWDQVFGFAGWSDGYRHVEFSQEDMKMMQKIVEMCGLNPKVTTAREMDELNPIFECRDCSSFEKGRATMSWTAVLRHQQELHSALPQTHTLRILGEPDAIKFRERIKEEEM